MDQDQRVPPLHPEEPGPSLETIRHYEQRAHEYLRLGLWTLAFKYYYAYFTHLDERNESQLISQINFTKVANQMAQLYEGVDDDEYVAKSLLQILNLFPNNAIVLNLLGVFLFKKGEFFIAKHYLRRAISLPIKYLAAEKNLLHIKWHQVPRLHLRMLNDVIRNQAYYKAINKAINANYKRVYNIGAGCGLLTLIATSSDPTIKVIAFEENKTLAKIMENLIEKNRIKNRVVLHKQLSCEFKKKVPRGNLVITDMFDIALFGEHILTSLLHAIDHFIDEDHDYKIIPSSARLYVTGIESEQLSMRYRYIRKIPELKLENICIRAVETEPYDSVKITRSNCKFITNTIMFLNVDFKDEFQLLSILSGEALQTCELELIEDGRIDAFVVWFDLNLDDEITITTNPNVDNNVDCWEQAIFYLSHPINLNKNDKLTIKPLITQNLLNFSIENHVSFCDHCFVVSKETLTFLNDYDLVKALIRTSTLYRFNILTLIDYYCFPLFGLLMLKRGADIKHFYHNKIDLDLIRHVIKINDLDSDKFVSLHPHTGNDYLPFLKHIDMVMSNYVHTDGSWYRQTLPDELLLKYKTLILPKIVIVKAQLITSFTIIDCNSVVDCRCFDFGIAEEMDEFLGTEYPNWEDIIFVRMSNIVTFDVSEFTWDTLKQNATTTRTGIINGILIWYNIRFSSDPETEITTLHSTHYSRTCFVLPNSKRVEKDDIISICLERDDTYMKIYCD